LNDHYLLLHSNGLIKTNNQLELLDSIQFTNFFQFSEMTTDNNQQIFLLGGHDSEHTSIQVLDSSLNFLNEILVGQNNILPTDLEYFDNKLYVTGFYKNAFHISSDVYPYGESLLYQASPQHSSSLWFKIIDLVSLDENEKPDIGLHGISNNGIEVFSISDYCKSVDFQDLTLVVKNYGELPVEKFNLNARFRKCSSICNTYSEFYHCEKFDITTSIENISFSSKIKFFPNPVNELLSIELPDELVHKNFSVEIINTHGQLLKQHFTKNKKTEQIDVQDLAEGIYFLQIKNKKGNTFTNKFVKTK